MCDWYYQRLEKDEKQSWRDKRRREVPTGKRVAIFGSGPAGLTAAYYLAGLGHSVTVFETLPEAGSMLRVGIPKYHLHRDVLDREIGEIQEMGVKIETNKKIDSVNDLFSQGFDAVVGTHKGLKLLIPGADRKNILIGIDFLKDVHLGRQVSVGNKVLVIGGGNVAFDCARVARRLGAEEVHVACRESRETMPANMEEIRDGEEEGIVVHPARTFNRVLIDNGCISGVECQEVDACEFGEDGDVQIKTVEDSKHTLSADTIIFATGQCPDIPEGFELETGLGLRIKLDS